ncbi:STY1053 family phage-associated protein [Enterobacter bugandensis]|uniref:STY1053 family phage-associated protein n=1 Tax=Enterobacter bugandensis TaxID=881260 RepID=UPI003F4449B0
MKYVVSGGATLSFADGSKFELSQGIHDSSSFPKEVKDHWAFKAYARPIDEADLANAQSNEDLSASLVLLAEENNTLKAQLAEHEKTITALGNENTDLKAQLAVAQAPAGGKPADSTDKTDNTGGDAKNAKKQQASD